MLKSILIGPYDIVQGVFVSAMNDGRIVVKVGNQLYRGMPVDATDRRAA